MRANNYRQIFQFRSFRFFWLGYSASILGDALSRVALTWFVYEATGSAQALGWLTFWYTGPVVVGGLLAGWLLDRFDRRKVMLADNLLRAGVMMLVPMLHAWGQLEVWHVYLVAAVYGLLLMIPLAGGPALVPALVPRQHLATANALETLGFTLGGVIGPPLAGVLIAQLGAPHVIVLDVLSYLIFALMLTQVKLLAEDAPPASRQGQPYGLGAALRLLRQNKILLSTTLMFMTFNVGFGAMFVWLPILAGQRLGGGSELYGLLLGFLAGGEVFGSMLAGTWTLPLSLGRLICLAQLLAGVSLGFLWGSSSGGVVLTGLTLFGLFSAPLTIWAQTLRMQIIPEPLRGRTFALLRTLMQGANPLGGMLAGGLLPLLGLPPMIGLSALLVGLPGALGYRVADLRGAGQSPHRAGDGVEPEI